MITDCTQNAQGVWIPDGMTIADQHAMSYFHANVHVGGMDSDAPTNTGCFEQCDCPMAAPAPMVECCE
jgi:hypothetical protein